MWPHERVDEGQGKGIGTWSHVRVDECQGKGIGT
jgi:hypothetical protein